MAGAAYGCGASAKPAYQGAGDRGRSRDWSDRFDHGLIFSIRRSGSVLRFVPPATTQPDQIDRAMDILGEAIEAASVKRSSAPGVALA